VKDLEKIIISFGTQEELNPKIWDNPDDAPKSHMKLEIRNQLEEIAEELEVSIAVFKRWKKDMQDFRAAVKRGRTKASTRVVSALLRNAIGWKEIIQEDRILPNGAVVSVTNTKRHPGQVTAQIFWLKNRMRAKWFDEAPRQPAAAIDPASAAKIVRDAVKSIEQLEGLAGTQDKPSE
jgi:hypothetical protein